MCIFIEHEVIRGNSKTTISTRVISELLSLKSIFTFQEELHIQMVGMQPLMLRYIIQIFFMISQISITFTSLRISTSGDFLFLQQPFQKTICFQHVRSRNISLFSLQSLIFVGFISSDLSTITTRVAWTISEETKRTRRWLIT